MKVCLALVISVLLASGSAFQLTQSLQTVSSLHGSPVKAVSSPVFSTQPARRQQHNTAGSLFSAISASSRDSLNIAMSSTKYDVVVYGATSFAGQLVCEYYLTTYGASPPTFKWAVAAR